MILMSGPHESTDAPDLSSVPLFPLPGVVLFPRAVLPLHIFEERYKTMMADALRGDRQIAMALLRPGWEREYHGKPAIDPVVCVGNILSHERLPDGKYNLLLQGQARARIVREHDSDSPYRVAELQALPETEASSADMDAERDRLSRLFRTAMLGGTPVGRQFSTLLAAGDLRTQDVADLVAFNYLEDVALKQSLLGESDVLLRVRRTLDALEASRPALQAAAYHAARESDPSLN
jgi:Lon protease-like protein